MTVVAHKEADEKEQVVKVQPEENIEFVILQIWHSCCLLHPTFQTSADFFQHLDGHKALIEHIINFKLIE